jgi:hypothetical protein
MRNLSIARSAVKEFLLSRLRLCRLRVGLHLYNTDDDIARLVEASGADHPAATRLLAVDARPRKHLLRAEVPLVPFLEGGRHR